MNAFDLYFGATDKEQVVIEKEVIKAGMKKCVDCKQIKPESEFYKKGFRNGKQQTRSDCICCRKDKVNINKR